MAENVKQKANKEKTVEIFAHGNQVRSTIIFSNPENKPLKLKSINITGTDLRDVGGQTLKQVSFFAKLRPGQVQRLPLEFDIDPTIPPGTYNGRFECGEHLQQPFILHILEYIGLSIMPSKVYVRGVPGQQLSKEMVIANGSNVPITLDREITMMLYEENELNRTFEYSMRNSDEGGFIKIMDNLVAKLKETIVDPMSIRFETNDLQLHAGETRKFSVSLTIPVNIKPGRSYQGRTNIYNAQLSMILYGANEKEVS